MRKKFLLAKQPSTAKTFLDHLFMAEESAAEESYREKEKTNMGGVPVEQENLE